MSMKFGVNQRVHCLSGVNFPVSSMQSLQPDWNKRLIDDLQYEASLLGLRLLQNSGRRVVWTVCTWFGCEKHGVPGMACQLFERYLFFALNEYHSGDDGTTLSVLKSRVPPLLAACIMLASKMNTASPVVPKTIPVVFACHRISCTLDDIITNELIIYQKLGFRIPLWTNVEKGEMLAMELGVSPARMSTVAYWVNMAEYRRNVINEKLFEAAMPSAPRRIVLTLHLVAGAVAAAVKLLPFAKDPVARLAFLTNTSQEYLERIRDVITPEESVEIPRRIVRPIKRCIHHQ